MKIKFVTLLFSMIFVGSAVASEVSYPEDYRNWKHVKSMVIMDSHPLANPFEGIHHIYANDKAVSGYKSGKFTDGSVLVFDLLKSSIESTDIQESNRKLIGVMVKDSNIYRKTGGWGFEGFLGDSKNNRITKDNGVSCFNCHESEKTTDYVFSSYRK